MLILAGLLGMMAVGSIMLFEPGSTQIETDEDPIDVDEETNGGASTQVGDTSVDLLSYIDEDGETQTIANETTKDGDLLFGTHSDDQISGDDGDDKIMAGGGNDTIDGGNDDDMLHGNGGNDQLFGGQGYDALFGDQGADDLSGGDGNDTLEGNNEDDRLSGGAGDDNLFGGTGDDTLFGDEGDDTLVGSAGRDILVGGDGQDVMFAGDGDDLLSGIEFGSNSFDFLNGGDGDDTIFAGVGDDVSGGNGADTVVLDAHTAEAVRIWDFEAGEDTLVFFYEGDENIPDINISNDPADENGWLVQNNGITIAQVTGDAPTLEDINLVQRS